LIRAEDVAAGYRGQPVLEDVGLYIRDGEFTAVVGPNASGKTTLLKTLAGLLKPLKGVVYVDGRRVSEMDVGELARSVGVVLTENVRPGLLTVQEVVALGRYPYTGLTGRLRPVDRAEVLAALGDVGIQHLADKTYNILSDGQRQKVMVARALAQKPQALILDEPVTYLDPKARVELLLTLRRICRQRKIAVIASLHEIELALRVADRLLVVAAGRVKAYGSPEEFVEDGGPVEIYEFGEDAGFCAETLTVEARPQPSEGFKVFVIAGAGRGAPVYRMLARLNTPFATGVLHEGDLDYYVAKSLGGEVIAEKAFHQISLEKLEQALTTASKADAAIYVSHPVGPTNAANTALAEKLTEKGIPTIVYGDAAVKGCWAKVERLSMLADILKQLAKQGSREIPKTHLIQAGQQSF
jgi:iron complex transport system ATP-binding protein